MTNVPIIAEWPDKSVSGSKNMSMESDLNEYEGPVDYFIGCGRELSCQPNGTWWDVICLARNILASENTKLAAPEYYHPEMKNENYADTEPYIFRNG